MGKVFALKFEGKRYDLGDPLGYVTSVLEVALQKKELKESLLGEIRRILALYEKL